MRTTTPAQLASLQATEYTNHHRVDVQNDDGTWINYRTAAGYDWLRGYSVAQNVDQPVWDIRVRFQRENLSLGPYSLSPTRADSPLNVDDSGAFAPAIDSGRGIRIYTCTLPAGISEPADSDWVLLIEGEIDDVDQADEDMQVTARSAIGAKLADRFIEDLTEYGTGGSVAVETAMQEVIDDWVESPPTLYTPVSPGFNVNPTKFRGISVYEALLSYAALIGYYAREMWDNGTSAFRLTFEEPDRAPASTDHTFSSDDYFDVQQLRIHRDRVRNAVRVRFHDSSGAQQVTDWAEDAASIARYGRKIYEIYEPKGSPIDTLAEAEALRDAVHADLKDPTMDKQVECRFFWPVQLGDYYTFSANGIHYDTDQELAVTGFLHDVSIGEQGEDAVEKTFLFLTGKPVAFGAYWQKRRRSVDVRPQGSIGAPPVVAAAVSQSGSTGSLDLTVEDPDLVVTSVVFAKKIDSGAYGALQGGADWDRSTGTVGTDTTIVRGEDVALAAKHSVSIRYVVNYNRGHGAESIEGAHSFDSNLVAEITAAEISFDANGAVVVSVQGDEDCADIFVTVGDGSAPSDPTDSVNDGTVAARNGTIATGVKITTGSDAFVKVVGYDANGVAGPVRTFQQARRIGPFHKTTSAVQLTGTTSETTLYSTTIPAGRLGLNGGLLFEFRIDGTVAPAGTRTLRVKLGSATIFTTSSGLAEIIIEHMRVFNDGATNDQHVTGFGLRIGVGVPPVLGISGSAAEDSTADMDLEITGQLSNAADEMTLDYALVSLVGTD